MNASERAQKLNEEAGINTNHNATVSSSPAGTPSNGPSIQEQLDELKKPKYSIVADPIDFEATTGTKLITTFDLADKINGMFRPIFKDYSGCNICLHTINLPAPNANGANGVVGPDHQVTLVQTTKLEVDLYFTKGASVNVCTAGAIDNVIDNSKLTKDGKRDHAAQIAFINEQNNPTNRLTINEATRDMLDPFYMPYYRRKTDKTATVTDPATGDKLKKTVQVMRPNYDSALVYGVSESSSQFNYIGNRTDYVKVTCLDLNLLLRYVYGTKNEEDHPVDYNVRIVRPLINYGNMPSNVLCAVLEISRLDCVVIKNLLTNLGMMQSVYGGLPIIR